MATTTLVAISASPSNDIGEETPENYFDLDCV